ncbi:MAG: CHAT domain-containing protein [Rubrivivax sp.]|nr:MAG: CHAT domain-containing protein [Rubrivivax sp.]
MTTADEWDNFKPASPDFYLTEMRRAVAMVSTAPVADLAFPIFSFFHGARTEEREVETQTGHVCVLFTREIRAPLREDSLLIRWVEIIYYYFREMAAVPELAREVWKPLWQVLAQHENDGWDVLPARIQMANWAGHYDQELAEHALSIIKATPPYTPQAEAIRALFLTTNINQQNADFREYVQRAYQLAESMEATHRLQALTTYYSHFAASDQVFNDILASLRSPELSAYKSGTMSLLGGFMVSLFDRNEYDHLWRMMCAIKEVDETFRFVSAHAFIVANHRDRLMLLSRSNRVSFDEEGNGQSYVELAKLCNRMTNVAISLLGDTEVDYRNAGDRFGTPGTADDLGALRDKVVAHYHLDDDVYRELAAVSLVPSHNHPIHGGLCSVGVAPPPLLVSFRPLPDRADQRRHLCLVSADTMTCDLECEWITQEFGNTATLMRDPGKNDLLGALSDQAYSDVYVSAHGQYSHHQSHEPYVHFSEQSKLSASELAALTRAAPSRRTVVLNICDGATTTISINSNAAGLGAAWAHGGAHVIVSHLWPVPPLYACTFGLLMLTFRDLPESEAVLEVYRQLDADNQTIADRLRALRPHFGPLAERIERSALPLGNFRNIGAIALLC